MANFVSQVSSVTQKDPMVWALLYALLNFATEPKNHPSIKKKLWGGALWMPSYFAGSCGGAPIEVIRQYIEQQQTPR